MSHGPLIGLTIPWNNMGTISAQENMTDQNLLTFALSALRDASAAGFLSSSCAGAATLTLLQLELHR